MLRNYEIVYIFSATLDEEAVNAKLESYGERLFAGGGETSAVDHWGTRQLAYPIKRQNQGYYVVTQFTADPTSLPEFERIIKLDDELMRYLVVLHEGEPTTGRSIVSDAPVRASEDDDEEDEPQAEAEASGEEGEEGEDANRTSPPEFSGGRARRRRIEGPRIELLNYKDVDTLSRFITEQGKLLPKRTSKVTAQFQRRLGTAVKRARFLALLPYIRDHEA
jgi:small subunit ribosomal protein S6